MFAHMYSKAQGLVFQNAPFRLIKIREAPLQSHISFKNEFYSIRTPSHREF